MDVQREVDLLHTQGGIMNFFMCYLKNFVLTSVLLGVLVAVALAIIWLARSTPTEVIPYLMGLTCVMLIAFVKTMEERRR